VHDHAEIDAATEGDGRAEVEVDVTLKADRRLKWKVKWR
jgi:hypothetical protein